MTIESKLSASLADMSIVLLCKKCGTRTTYELRRWDKGDTKCPKCGAADYNRLETFREALCALLEATPTDIAFEVRVELSR
jgi:hypothetical protein